MGAANSSGTPRLIDKPQDLSDFRKLLEPSQHYDIPELPHKRKVTDKYFTIIFGVSFLILFGFMGYTLYYSNILRITNGFDKCGNICGIKNKPVSGILCSGGDETKKPFVEFGKSSFNNRTLMQEKCVKTCPRNTNLFLNRCFPKDEDLNHNRLNDPDLYFYLNKFKTNINNSAGKIVAMCCFGLVMNIVMLFLFRYFTSFLVWFSLIAGILGLVTITVLFGFFYGISDDYDGGLYLFHGIAFAIISIVLILVVVSLIKKIKLIIRLFREGIKIIFEMPLILLEPLLTFFAHCIVLTLFCIVLLVMSSSGFLTKISDDNYYTYLPNEVMVFTVLFTLGMAIWMMNFIIGCQHMVISGAVSASYFARDKSELTDPIYNSFYNLVRYHLGTVAFGSLIITIVSIVKALLKSLAQNKHTKLFVHCCLSCIEGFLKYLSKNAYIQTAMHGQSFYKSGKRAANLLVANALSAIAVNSVGDFVIFIVQFWIILATVLFGLLINNDTIENFFPALLIGASVTGVLTQSFFTVFETAVDTIFLCFCEDSCLNDGETRPYYMTTNMMQVFEDAKSMNPKKLNLN